MELSASLDLIFLNFFFWVYIKNIVFSEEIWNLYHLRDRIYDATGTNRREYLRNETEHQCDICRATRGAHIEFIKLS
jgi:hypothetical protein